MDKAFVAAFDEDCSMSRVALFVLAISASVAAVAAPGGAAGHTRSLASNYVVVDLGTLGGTTSEATAINDSGVVVGYSTVAGNAASHAFVWRTGVMTDLGTLPGGMNSRANAINDRGQIAGASEALIPSASGSKVVASQAFVYSHGKMIDIDPLTSLSYTPGSWAYGINDAGQVVGNVLTPSGDSLAFRYSHGSFSQLSVAGAEPQAFAIDNRGRIVGSTWADETAPFLYAAGSQVSVGTAPGRAVAINGRGIIAGSERVSAGQHAFMSTVGGTPVDLGTLGGQISDATAVDNVGRVVGSAETAGGAAHAFMYQHGAMVDLNTQIAASSGWVLENATGLNDRGQIVGVGAHNGVEHAFLLMPRPRHHQPAP